MKSYTVTVRWLTKFKTGDPRRNRLDFTAPIAEHATEWAAAQMAVLAEKGLECWCGLTINGAQE